MICQCFLTLDLSSGYWQIKVHPDSREKTAFVTHLGLHEFCVIPFAFQRLMQQVLLELNPAEGDLFVAIYIDDMLIYSRTLKEHLRHLGLVMKRLIES